MNSWTIFVKTTIGTNTCDMQNDYERFENADMMLLNPFAEFLEMYIFKTILKHRVQIILGMREDTIHLMTTCL